MILTYIQQSGSPPVGDGGDQYTGLDRFGRVIDQRWIKESSGADLERVQYGFDRASNRVWRDNTVADALSAKQDEFYTYDGLNQLLTLQRGTLNPGKTGISGTPAWEEDFTIDPTGNWDNYVNQVNGTTTLNQPRTHNSVNEVATISGSSSLIEQNAAGNMSKAPKPLDWSTAYTMTYDAWQRLVKVKSGSTTTASYAYDGQNRRTTKTIGTTTRHYYYSSQWQILEERLNTATTSDRQFVWGLMALDNLVLRDRGTERFYSLQDVFSCTAIVDTSGTVQERYGYNAFGLSRVMTATFTSRTTSSYDWETRYDNYRFDLESSFYQVRFRYLHPTLGRWLTRDPIGYDAGINLYSYCLNNGLNFIDPDGLQSKTFEIVGKSYIAHIGKNIGSVPGGNEAALYWLAKATDLAYSENPRTSAKDQHYRLYSEKSFCAACDKSGNLTYTSTRLDMDAGKEGPFTGSISKVYYWEILTSGTLQFSWKVHGRPNRAVESGFTLVKKRNCWYIWHIISGTISCQNGEPTASISISSSNFPSSREWLNGRIKGGTVQGPFSNLWVCSSSVPNEIQ